MGKSNTEQLQIAKKYLGKGGATFRKWTGLPSGAAYCNAFVCYIFAQAGNSSLYYGGKKGTYCPTTIRWCYNNLASIPIYLALPMDVIYFDWNGNNDPNHIGFVRERKSDQEIYTIEGNTSGGIVAQKTRTLYGKYNGKTVRYIQAVFRPHYKPSGFNANKKLTVDGYFGYNSIAVMQRWLGVKADAILKRSDIIALQKKLKVNADADWGVATSKALQKLIGVTADGAFGPKSTKAFQTYLNKAVFGSTASTPSKVTASAPKVTTKTWADKANDWAVKIANDNSYHYVKWTSNSKTHECPVCKKHPKGATHGWNCIGFAFSCWKHGAGLKSKCNCGVIANEVWDKLRTASDADKMATQRVGIPVKVIRNGGKTIPLSSLKKGDICALFRGTKYYHTIYYMGGGKYAESNTTGGIGNAKNIRANITLSATAKKNIKVAIRPV